MNIIAKLTKRFFIKLLLVSLSFGLTGCFKDDGVDQKYFKTFEHIKTDQFVWNPGLGGIYWVSNDSVVLEALIKNKNGEFEKGIYQVNMDGTYILLVSLKSEGPYSYCFDGKNLYLRNSTGKFDVVNFPKKYGVILLDNINERGKGQLRPIRCRYINKPTNNSGYIALKEDDGYVKRPYPTEENPNPNVYLSDNRGNNQSLIDDSGIFLLSRATYLKDRDSYFFNRNRGRCSYLTWLERDGWDFDYRKHCFGEWAKSIVIVSPKDGLYVENYTLTEKHKTYFVIGDKEYPLETTSSRQAVVAPDGCKIAYGSGNYRARNRGPNDFRQVLKVFNSCAFIADKDY